MIAFTGYSKSATLESSLPADTTKPGDSSKTFCFPRYWVLNALKTGDSLSVALKIIAEQDSIINYQDQALKNADSVNKKLDSIDARNLRQFERFEKIVTNLRTEFSLSEAEKKKLNAIIRRKNWTIVKIAGISVTAVGALTYLLIQK